MRIKETLNNITKEDLQAIIADPQMSKSQKVRILFEGGYDVKEIAGFLGIRYNFAYNVLQNYIIMNDVAVNQEERSTKREEITGLLSQGLTLAEVSKLTKTNYNYIWKINQELKADQAAKAQVKEVVAEKKAESKVTTKKAVNA